jgi:hypothetical protein
MDRMLVTKLFARSDGKWLLVHFHAHFPGFPIPGTTQHVPLGQEPTNEQPSDDVARASAAFYAAFAKQDLESMSREWAQDEDVSAIHPSSPAPFLGRDEVIRSWKQAFTDIEAVFIRPRLAIRHQLGVCRVGGGYERVPRSSGRRIHREAPAQRVVDANL